MNWGLKEGISIGADSGPPMYVLWCCGGICHQPDTFILIGSGHTVQTNTKLTLNMASENILQHCKPAHIAPWGHFCWVTHAWFPMWAGKKLI